MVILNMNFLSWVVSKDLTPGSGYTDVIFSASYSLNVAGFAKYYGNDITIFVIQIQNLKLCY